MFRKTVPDDRSSDAETSFADRVPLLFSAERRPARPERFAVDMRRRAGSMRDGTSDTVTARNAIFKLYSLRHRQPV